VGATLYGVDDVAIKVGLDVIIELERQIPVVFLVDVDHGGYM
jgi:hypothetical protein